FTLSYISLPGPDCSLLLSCSTMYYIALFFTLLLTILCLQRKARNSSKNLPPGSLGFPFIGQSFALLRALRTNTAEKWLEERAERYGPISKLTLFGTKTVFIHGQAANKFKLLGKKNLLELSGEDHKRVRGALMAFLKPEALKQYVGKMDGEIREHLKMYWEGKQNVTVLPLMKTLTFNIMCSLIFGLERGTRRENFICWFQHMLEGLWSVPVDLPFTRFNRSIQASSKIQSMLMDIIHEKRSSAKQHNSPPQDLITSLLSMCADNAPLLSDKEIVANVMFILIAGQDTSAVLLTFLVRQLANDPVVYAAILKEQEEIAKSKTSTELLTWEDLTKMKYTWRAALEILRIFPPVFAGFRRTRKDIEFGGYLIPKGWQVLWAANMTHMNDSIFPEPSKFEPSRFENQVLIPPYCFVAFGGGPRICPGYEFARIETLVTVHYLVTRFTWELHYKDNKFIRDPTPIPTQGLPIQIERKNRF
ncbi:hypothetical protein AQUCO_02800027v1, partial [Aquilegia coerulea]